MYKHGSTAIAAACVLAVAAWVTPAAAWHFNQRESSQPGTSQGQMSRSSQGQTSKQPQALRQEAFDAMAAGQVTSVDHSTGRITVKTDEGPVTARFPADVIRDVRVGDQVNLHFGLEDQSLVSASPSAAPNR